MPISQEITINYINLKRAIFDGKSLIIGLWHFFMCNTESNGIENSSFALEKQFLSRVKTYVFRNINNDIFGNE